MLAYTAPLRRELAAALPDRPFTLEFWDGTRLAPTAPGGLTVFVRSPRAIGHVLHARSQLGLARAYVAGELDVDDLDELTPLIDGWKPPALDRRTRLRLAVAGARAAGLARMPCPPAAELQVNGRQHDPERDTVAVRHHYELPPEFYALFLDTSMTYSCALFSRGAATLEAAQEAKLELSARKLALEPGQRVLDVGCGWGAFAIHAARHHGAHVLGITLSKQQAAFARRRAESAGVAARTEFRVMDYRDVRGWFDAIVSIGMVEHVGQVQIDRYAQGLAGQLRPGGRLLNHGIATLCPEEFHPSEFTQRYVFPDGELLHLSRTLAALEQSGLETLHVEGLRADYATTLHHWARRLDQRLDQARRLVGKERTRVWRLYLRGAAHGFETGMFSVYQVLTVRDDRRSPALEAAVPEARRTWVPALASSDGERSELAEPVRG